MEIDPDNHFHVFGYADVTMMYDFKLDRSAAIDLATRVTAGIYSGISENNVRRNQTKMAMGISQNDDKDISFPVTFYHNPIKVVLTHCTGEWCVAKDFMN